MDNKKKRTIPRHVDGRLKIGTMTLVNFFKFLPVALCSVIFTLSKFSPITLVLGIIISGFTFIIFSEIVNKETGLDVIKSIIKYRLEGDIVFERRINKKDVKKIIFNKIK